MFVEHVSRILLCAGLVCNPRNSKFPTHLPLTASQQPRIFFKKLPSWFITTIGPTCSLETRLQSINRRHWLDHAHFRIPPLNCPPLPISFLIKQPQALFPHLSHHCFTNLVHRVVMPYLEEVLRMQGSQQRLNCLAVLSHSK